MAIEPADITYVILGPKGKTLVTKEHWVECMENFRSLKSEIAHYPTIRERVPKIVLTGEMAD